MLAAVANRIHEVIILQLFTDSNLPQGNQVVGPRISKRLTSNR